MEVNIHEPRPISPAFCSESPRERKSPSRVPAFRLRAWLRSSQKRNVLSASRAAKSGSPTISIPHGQCPARGVLRGRDSETRIETQKDQGTETQVNYLLDTMLWLWGVDSVEKLNQSAAISWKAGARKSIFQPRLPGR